jgi:hypothetical protein
MVHWWTGSWKKFSNWNRATLELTGCNNLIVIDRQYFLDNEDLVRDWVLNKKNS